MKDKYNLIDCGVICSLGASSDEVYRAWVNGVQTQMKPVKTTNNNKTLIAGLVNDDWLNSMPDHIKSRNDKLLWVAAKQIDNSVKKLLSKTSPLRVGVVIGTSTSGIREGESASKNWFSMGNLPEDYNYFQQEMGQPAEFIADLWGISGPCYGISTACSSSGKVFASAQSLLDSGIVDAVVVGGADSLCQLTLQGFSALEAVSEKICNPFSKNRDGINIGEGAALFLMTKSKEEGVHLVSVGESSDAHHMSAPEPEGKGAEQAMRSALNKAKLSADDIDYINLHGTATPLNDIMESKAVQRIFANNPVCSSSKPLTGHCLGAAGAIEVALCWLLLKFGREIPKAIWDEQFDSNCANIHLATGNESADDLKFVLSNSFAFGGSNVSVILGK